MFFQDRRDAGRRLAGLLAPYHDDKPVVLGIPRGGVIVAAEAARALHAPLDVVVARKLGAPGNPELGIGALGPHGMIVIDRDAIRDLSVSDAQLENTIAEQQTELERRIRLFRDDRPVPDLRGRTVIVIDDGLATGVTARAAVRGLQQDDPARLVFAVPVGAPETIAEFRSEVDDVVCVSAPVDMHAIGLWYEDFRQVSDHEVIACLTHQPGDIIPPS
jgi:putative phosphoribosyl transferase